MSKEMKINYYDQFKCVADACTFTCCQEWRIGVDQDTLKKWQGVKLEANQAGKNSEVVLANCVKKDGAGHVIALDKDKKCPFLNEQKLCKLVMHLGEDYLSETCTTFPRQINHFENRTEYSLDPGCPAVVDLLYKTVEKVAFSKLEQGEQADGLLMHMREMILTLMEQPGYTLPERLMISFYAVLELMEEAELTEEKIRAYTKEKTLAPIAKAIRGMRFNLGDSFFERNELFLDVVENYRKQKLYTAYLEPIAKVAEELEAAYDEAFVLKQMAVFETELLNYEQLIKNYLIAEIFGNALMPEMTLEDVVMSFEWITLEYAVLKQALFLRWFVDKKDSLAYETVRDYMNVISRVTGYELEDIKEYLENSFESSIWEWGYLALVVGNSKM